MGSRPSRDHTAKIVSTNSANIQITRPKSSSTVVFDRKDYDDDDECDVLAIAKVLVSYYNS